MDFNPKISILIPVYNGSNYMRESIESALTQTYPNKEILVINDGSTDGGKTESIAKSYGDQIWYFYKENGGVSTALNIGLKEMHGEYFSWLSHDDVYYPDKLEKQIRFLSQLPDKNVFIYSDYAFINSKSEIIGENPNNPINTRGSPGFRFAMVPYNKIFFCTALVSKKCFDETGQFNSNLPTTQDYEMCFRIAKKFPFVYFPEKTIKLRLHKDQGTVVIPRQTQETDNLLLWMIRELENETVPEDKKKLVPLYFLRQAVNFKKRDFLTAAPYAYALGMKNIYNYDLITSIQGFIYSTFYKTYKKKLSIMYWIRLWGRPVKRWVLNRIKS